MVDGARRRTGVAEEAIEWNEVLCGGALGLSTESLLVNLFTWYYLLSRAQLNLF